MALIEPGQMLGKYQIVQQIGVGGMSEIYEALDTTLQRPVALKVLPPEFSTDSEHVQRFRKEVLAVAALDHPGIVTIFDVGSADELQFYAMTLLPEGNLKTRMAGNALPPAEALAITRALASALQHAHDQSIIHRDIKPENVLFGKDGAPVLVDFGIVKVLNSASQLTQVGTSVGTPYYMSPEQAQSSKNVDARSDLYSLGVMLHEMLTGQVPFDAATSVGIALQHVNQPIPTLPPALGELQPLLNSLMAKQQDARPASGQAVMELIDAVAAKVQNLPALHAGPADPEPDAATGAQDAAAARGAERPAGNDRADTQQREQIDSAGRAPAKPRTADPATEFELMSVTPPRNPAQQAKRPPDPANPGPGAASPASSGAGKDGEAARATEPPADSAGTGPETALQIMVPTGKGKATAAPPDQSADGPRSGRKVDRQPDKAADKSSPASKAAAGKRGQDPAPKSTAAPSTGTGGTRKTPKPPAPEISATEAGATPGAATSRPEDTPVPADDPGGEAPPAGTPPPPAAQPQARPKPAVSAKQPEAKPSHLRETTLIPAVKAPGNKTAQASPETPPVVDSGPEAERWKVDDLYQKPPSQWHRKPAVWGGAAVGLAVLVLVVVLAGRGDEEASPLELVTGEGSGAGIGLGNQARQREPEEAQGADASTASGPQPDETGVEEPAPDAPDPEENLDALLAEMLVDQAAEDESGDDTAAAPTTAPADDPDDGATEPQASASPPASQPAIQPATQPAAARAAPVSESPGAPAAASASVADRTPPPASPEAGDPKVAQLLLDAELLIAADQLTLPEGENAWEAFQQVLDLDAGNREALRGLARLQRTYVNRINAALADGDRELAGRLTERLRFIDPLHPDLAEFDARLGRDTGASAPFQDSLNGGGNGPLMIPLPAARVALGDPEDESSGTSLKVSLPAFALAAHEVTVGEYRQYAEATGLPAPASAEEGCNYWLFNWRQRADKSWDSPGFTQSESHPVVCVSYNDALAYAGWLSEQSGFSYSLPTEYQWEYAAAMDSQSGVYWTSARDACGLANVSDLDRAERHNLEISSANIFGCRDRRVNTAPVGSYDATEAGFYDLLGNAGEWTADCWRQDYASRSGKTGCAASAVRGASWFERPQEVSVHHRLRLERDARFSHIGFRVARAL